MADMNLRKVSKLLKSIDRRVDDYRHAMTDGSVVRIDPNLMVDDASAKLDEAAKELTNGILDLQSLLHFRMTIRKLFLAANQEANVNDLLAEKHSLEKERSALEYMVGGYGGLFARAGARPADITPRPDTNELRATLKTKLDSIQAGSGNALNSTVKVAVLDASQEEHWQGRIVRLDRKIEDVQDQLERINVLTVVDIPDETLKQLEDLKVV